MSQDASAWLQSELPKHERLREAAIAILKNAVSRKGIDVLHIGGRTKIIESALEKISRKSYTDFATQIINITGIRIVAFLNEDVAKISKIIRELFEIDKPNSRDQADMLGSDKIGYRSVHFVCCLGTSRSALTEYEGLDRLSFEIQVRTVLQHAWAELAHDRAYKFSGGLPTQIQRKLNLYSGMLEIVDFGFDEISREIDFYKISLRSPDYIILDEEINSLSVSEYMTARLQAKNIKERFERPFGDPSSEILDEMKSFGILKIGDLNEILIDRFINVFLDSCGKHWTVNKLQQFNGLIRYAMISKNPNKYFTNIERKSKNIPRYAVSIMIDCCDGDSKLIEELLAKSDLIILSA